MTARLSSACCQSERSFQRLLVAGSRLFELVEMGERVSLVVITFGTFYLRKGID